MKARSVIRLSVAGLLVIVLIQLGGMYYAYKAQMKEAEQTLNECFSLAFSDMTNIMQDQLPYPDGTIVSVFFVNTLNKDINAYANQLAQQCVQTMQKAYGVEFRLAELDSVLHQKLSRVYIKGEVAIERFNVDTGEILETTNTGIGNSGFTTVCSEKIFVYKEKGEAVRAIVRFPFGEMMRNVLILSVITLLLLGIVVYVLVLQMRSLIHQQHNLQKQKQDFYVLTEQMRLPVDEMSSKISGQLWNEIENDGTTLLTMIEKMLSKVKVEASLQHIGRVISLKTFSIVTLVGIFLLLSIWSVYLYRIGYRKLELQVQDSFEEAFFRETTYHRFASLLLDQKYPMPNKITGMSPYARKLVKAIREQDIQKKYNVRPYPFYITRMDPNGYENASARLSMAYLMQDTINAKASIPIPFLMEYADSVFSDVLREKGLPDKSSIVRMKYPLGGETIYADSLYAANLDMTTQMIPLDKDSTYCVQGILHAPQGYIIASNWYMLLPLGIIFLFMGACVYFQIQISRTQRRLKQFQKDFTYSMIHDMKSPLSSIIMGSQILASGKLAGKSEKEDKYKLAITDECEHLSVLLNRVLMLTQLDEGHLELNKEEVPLRPLMDDLLAKISLKAGKKIEFNTLYHRCETVYADAFCLREVLSNLLDNAIKYSRDEVKIDIICESEKGFSKIKICDNGLGIPVKDLSRIFNRFERSVAAARSSKGGATGFGLGLNYVQQVMLAHEGRVEVESEEGRFSEFTLYFPVRE